MRLPCLFHATLLAAAALALASPASAQDADGDGVLDGVDNCEFVRNVDQLDADLDGRGNACECGDFTGDGRVNTLDARLIQRCTVGQIPCSDLCDVTGDGECTTLDARLIQRFAVGQLGKDNLLCDVPFPPIPFEGVVCEGNLATSACTIDVKGIPFQTTRGKIDVVEPGAALQSRSTGAVGAASIGTSGGLVVTDDLAIPTPFGDIALVESTVEIALAEGGGFGPFETIVGTTRVPFPDIGFLAGAQVDETPMASLGLDLGANLDLGIPLIADRQYLFFDFSSTFGASLGPVSFSVGGPSATLALDPFDPFFYVGGSLGGLIPGDDGGNQGGGDPPPEEGGPDDLGFGISLSGFIPFAPDTTHGIEGDIGVFLGNLLLKADVPFPPLPLSLDGITIANIDPDGDGPIFFDLDPDLQLGGNGLLKVGIPFLTFLEFGFDLGTASAAVELSESDVLGFFSGELDPDDPYAMFPPEFPIPIRQNPQQVGARVAGLFSAANLSSSFVRAEGEFSIDLGPLGAPIGVNLGELASSSVLLAIDASGLEFRGMTQTQIVPIPGFANAAMSLDVLIPTDNPLNSSAELIGALTVAGLGLDPARVFISPLGFEVEGNLDLAPVAVLDVTGGIDSGGVALEGSFDSNISFNLQSTIDDILFEAQVAVDIAQDAVDFAQGAIDGCKDLCPGGCYLNPCCAACDAALGGPLLIAEAALFAAEEALNLLQGAVNLFFNALPFPIAGTILANVDVFIDNLNAAGAVSASFFGLDLGGSARFFPPQVCVTLPLGSFPGASTLGLGDEEFCLPPF